MTAAAKSQQAPYESPEHDAIAAAILAALPGSLTPVDLQQAMLKAGEKEEPALALFRKHTYSMWLDLHDIMVIDGIAPDVADRLAANELLRAAAFVVAAMKHRLGEEQNPARFAIAAYHQAELVRQSFDFGAPPVENANGPG